jgi:two-component system, OmpR family, KDP operon response regulator KdpE
MDARAYGRRTTVLMLTDEPALVRLARSILEPGRMVSGGAPLGPESLAAAGAADVVVIEVDAVDPDTLAEVRSAHPDAALIVLSPERRETDCIAALDMGADYLPRPFSSYDLAARVRVAELRRFAATGRPRFYRHGTLAFDLFNGKLSINGRAVALAPSERALLAHLAGRAGVVVAYRSLLEEAELAGSRHGLSALRCCVLRLRRKIEREPLHPEILLAEIGVGYRLAPPTSGTARRPRDCLPDDPK